LLIRDAACYIEAAAGVRHQITAFSFFETLISSSSNIEQARHGRALVNEVRLEGVWASWRPSVLKRSRDDREQLQRITFVAVENLQAPVQIRSTKT
jgi:hypothetical protein